MAKARILQTILVFVDDDNAPIPRADVVTFMREKFKDEYEGNGELTASDEKLLATLEAIPGDESNATNREAIQKARWEALLTLVEEVKHETPSAIDSPLGRLAVEIGSKIDAETDNLVTVAVDKKEEYEGAPLAIAEHLVVIFGGKLDDDKTILACDYIVENFPWPGSNAKELPAGSNVRCDRYTWHDQSGTEHAGYFLGDVHASTPGGREIEQRLDAIKLLKADPTSQKIGFGYRTAFLVGTTIDPIKRDAEEQYLRNRRTSRINRMARAIKYIHNAVGLHTLKDVHYTFVQDTDDRRLRANKPIKLLTGSGKKMVPHEKPLSLSQFVNMNIEQAKLLGGTMANLIGTMKRSKKTDATTKQGGGVAALEGPTADTATKVEWIEAHMNNWNSAYIGETDDEKKVAALNTSKFMTYLNKPGSEGMERRATFRDYVDSLQSILAHYGKMLEEDAKQQTQGTKKVA